MVQTAPSGIKGLSIYHLCDRWPHRKVKIKEDYTPESRLQHRQEPRRDEMERKVRAEKGMKGRPEQGSRQGHRCDIPLTIREAG